MSANGLGRLCAAALCAAAVSACGGGGSGGGGGGHGGNPPPASQTLYVRASGSDDATGLSPDHAMRTLANASRKIAPGTTIYVGPGNFRGRVQVAGVAGTADAPVRLIADPNGDRTGDAPGDVVLDADATAFTIRVQNSPYVTIDGFTINGAVAPAGGGAASGIRVQGTSDHAVIQNCVIQNDVTADGIRIEEASAALIFNNLVVGNNAGIVIRGNAADAQVINNTVVHSRSFGITLRVGGGSAPTGATLRNNLVQNPANNLSIQVDTGPPSALDGYTGDYDLVFSAVLGDQLRNYDPPDIVGAHDVQDDALFVDEEGEDFHLARNSPAVDAGTGNIAQGLASQLFRRTTSANGAADSAPPDLGYHYPLPR